MKQYYVLGAGGMAREVENIIKDLKKDNFFKGFIVQDKFFKDATLFDKPIITQSQLSHLDKQSIILINGIGSPSRSDWIEQLLVQGYSFESVIHPSATIGTRVRLGQGCVVGSFCVLTTDIAIGDFAIINTHVSISHDCVIGSYVTVGPGSHLAGNTIIDRNAFLGIGTITRPRVHIGNGTMTGAGSVIIDNIDRGMLAYGVPAKEVRPITKDDWKNLI